MGSDPPLDNPLGVGDKAATDQIPEAAAVPGPGELNLKFQKKKKGSAGLEG